MISFILLGALAIPVFAAPQGYEYRRPATVIDSFNPPCTHAAQNIEGVPLALIQSQSEGRIVNHKTNNGANHNLVTAASGYSPQLQANILHNAPPQHFANGGNGQQTSSIQSNGYSFNQATVAANAQNHNYPAPQFAQASAHQNIQQVSNAGSNFANSVLTSGGSEAYTGSLINAAYHYPGPQFSQTGNNLIKPDYSATSAFTHTHNIQQVTNAGSNLANSVLVSGGTESHTGSLVNAASHQSAALNSVTTNTNLDFNVGAINGQLGHVIRETFANAPLDPSIEKHIYVHIPPEDLEENNNEKVVNQHQQLTPPKKHYKIIFIKAPSHPTPNYSQLVAAPQVEEKTLVYVLVKKPDVPSIEQIQQIQQSSYKSSKPEVYFIKYKTRKDEKDSTQYSINSQYPNEIIDTQPTDTHSTKSDNGLIDIRSGGESNSISTSVSYSSSSNGANNFEPKHELYGVPLQ
ncbi:uncharacterized protein LOC135950924 [Calliphora vicina]|uniref:uncharacterized protein LOC135950924 n=1 Tax=Calliphora vicina TaxID=7373 RepID=UPI00325BEE98